MTRARLVPCYLLVEPHAGRTVDTAAVVTVQGARGPGVAAFSSRPQAARWREAAGHPLTLRAVRTTDTWGRLAATALFRHRCDWVVWNPQGDADPRAIVTDLGAWFDAQRPWAGALGDFLRDRGWWAEASALFPSAR